MATDQASDGRGGEFFLAALVRWFSRWWRREPFQERTTRRWPVSHNSHRANPSVTIRAQHG